MAAGLAMLREIDRKPPYAELERKGALLEEGVRRAIAWAPRGEAGLVRADRVALDALLHAGTGHRFRGARSDRTPGATRLSFTRCSRGAFFFRRPPSRPGSSRPPTPRGTSREPRESWRGRVFGWRSSPPVRRPRARRKTRRAFPQAARRSPRSCSRLFSSAGSDPSRRTWSEARRTKLPPGDTAAVPSRTTASTFGAPAGAQVQLTERTARREPVGSHRDDLHPRAA